MDSLISRDYGCPEAGSEEELLVAWLSSTQSLITNLTLTRPGLGWWAPSCPLHTLLGHQQAGCSPLIGPANSRLCSDWLSGLYGIREAIMHGKDLL